MLNSKLLLVSALFSFSAMAVTMEEKVNRVEYLEELSTKAISMDIDAYRRDLEYEKQGLSLHKRAANEANLLAEKVRLQVQSAYEAALVEKSSKEAYAEVKEAIEKDLDLIASDLREEIGALALSTLEQAERGVSNSDIELKGMQKTLLKDVRERAEYLNKEGNNDLPYSFLNTGIDNKEKSDYKSKEEIVESLVSSFESIKTNPSSTLNINSTDTTTSSTNISLRVQASFLGVEVNAGPAISFRREFKTRVSIQAEDLYPVLGADGNFDFTRKDNSGKILKKNGKTQKRIITMACDANLNFETDYSGGGGFSVVGLGVNANFSKKYSNSVGLVSRRILLPESIGNKTVTYKDLMLLCHNDFLKARVTNIMTIEQSLNIMMKNVASSIIFSHPKSKCAVDRHCLKWFNNEVIGLFRVKNTPRCAEEQTEKYRVCEVRGLTDQNCTLRDKNGKRISSGSFEFTCDAGLTCVKVREGGWFKGFEIYQYPKGQCRPINARTYKTPVY